MNDMVFWVPNQTFLLVNYVVIYHTPSGYKLDKYYVGIRKCKFCIGRTNKNWRDGIRQARSKRWTKRIDLPVNSSPENNHIAKWE
jgi:hypothetical protein